MSIICVHVIANKNNKFWTHTVSWLYNYNRKTLRQHCQVKIESNKILRTDNSVYAMLEHNWWRCYKTRGRKRLAAASLVLTSRANATKWLPLIASQHSNDSWNWCKQSIEIPFLNLKQRLQDHWPQQTSRTRIAYIWDYVIRTSQAKLLPCLL